MQNRRLADNLSRKTLSAQSGVPSPTIRHFETTGKISLVSLLQIAQALGCMDNFLGLFPEKPALTIDQFIAVKRQRGSK